MIAVALAGGFGAALRLVTDGVVRSILGDRLPWGTLMINVLGSASLGLLLGSGPDHVSTLVIGTGLLGGFTTFSTASLESAVLIRDRRWVGALVYTVGTLAACVGAAAVGYFLAASTAF